MCSRSVLENRLHSIIDVVFFRDDRAACAKATGAGNMAVVGHFALNLVRAVADTKSIKRCRKLAGREPRRPRDTPPGSPSINPH